MSRFGDSHGSVIAQPGLSPKRLINSQPRRDLSGASDGGTRSEVRGYYNCRRYATLMAAYRSAYFKQIRQMKVFPLRPPLFFRCNQL